MSVSKQTIDMVYAQLKAIPQGATYVELEKLTGYSRAALKQAISNLTLSGSVVSTRTKPVVIKAIQSPPMPGQTLIIKEAMPLLELDQGMMDMFERLIDRKDGGHKDPILHSLILFAREESPERNEKLMVVLINFAEVLRNRLESSKELSIEDVDGKIK